MVLLSQQVAIVTAAADGIGADCARALAAAGIRVAIADERDATSLAREIEARGGRAMALTADVTDEAGALAMTRTVADHFGRVDILINGTAWPARQHAPFDEIMLAEWDRVVGINLRGIFLCIRATVPYMQRQRFGRIINICPPASRGDGSGLHRATASAAILALTQSLAGELGATGISVDTAAGPADLLRTEAAVSVPRPPGAHALH